MAKKSFKKKSILTKNEFYLNLHDEEKALLFTSGILLGVGISVSVFADAFWYGGLSAIAIAAVLLLIEKRQELHDAK
jgi:hypothetical protein